MQKTIRIKGRVAQLAQNLRKLLGPADTWRVCASHPQISCVNFVLPLKCSSRLGQILNLSPKQWTNMNRCIPMHIKVCWCTCQKHAKTRVKPCLQCLLCKWGTVQCYQHRCQSPPILKDKSPHGFHISGSANRHSDDEVTNMAWDEPSENLRWRDS